MIAKLHKHLGKQAAKNKNTNKYNYIHANNQLVILQLTFIFIIHFQPQNDIFPHFFG